MRAPLALAAAMVLAGCGKPAEQPHASATPPAPVIAGGWSAVFADAPATVDLLNRMGFRLGTYQPADGGYRSSAVPTPMSDPSAKPVNVANLVVSGDARRVDALRFTLDIVNLDASPFAKTEFTRWIVQALGQLGVDGKEAVTAAVATEADVRGQLTGADYAVTRDKIDGGRRLVVTFTRPAAMPGTREPRKQ